MLDQYRRTTTFELPLPCPILGKSVIKVSMNSIHGVIQFNRKPQCCSDLFALGDHFKDHCQLSWEFEFTLKSESTTIRSNQLISLDSRYLLTTKLTLYTDEEIAIELAVVLIIGQAFIFTCIQYSLQYKSSNSNAVNYTIPVANYIKLVDIFKYLLLNGLQ